MMLENLQLNIVDDIDAILAPGLTGLHGPPPLTMAAAPHSRPAKVAAGAITLWWLNWEGARSIHGAPSCDCDVAVAIARNEPAARVVAANQSWTDGTAEEQLDTRVAKAMSPQSAIAHRAEADGHS